jgi:hypothetical protein
MSMTKRSAAFDAHMEQVYNDLDHSYELYLEEQYLSMERQARKGHTNDPQAEYKANPPKGTTPTTK